MIRLTWLITDWHHRNRPPYAAALTICAAFITGALLQ